MFYLGVVTMDNSGMDPLIANIRQVIESQLDMGKRKFIIYPFGDVGIKVKNILNNSYGIKEDYIIDNHLCQYNSEIQSSTIFEVIDCSLYTVLLSTTNQVIYKELKSILFPFFSEEQIVNITSFEKNYSTKRGKYSYGPLCDHWLVESVGAFCSFAIGTDVVQNHAINYISTHPFIYNHSSMNSPLPSYSDCKDEPWYFDGITPQGKVQKLQRIRIGNDVWLGKNVTITNGANIGNGVIAGAGAIITKDVPDYAIVAGIPARIIRYRYEQDEIASLNKIQWWNWSDDEIRERYDDFFLPIGNFIKKWDKK